MSKFHRIQRLDFRHKWVKVRSYFSHQKTYERRWYRCSACGEQVEIAYFGTDFINLLTREKFIPVIKKWALSPSPLFSMLMKDRHQPRIARSEHSYWKSGITL